MMLDINKGARCWLIFAGSSFQTLILIMNYLFSINLLSLSFLPHVGELFKGLKCLVSAVKIDLSLIDVYIIKNKAYYFFNFRVLERKIKNSGY
jgi:hypothetical protein